MKDLINNRMLWLRTVLLAAVLLAGSTLPASAQQAETEGEMPEATVNINTADEEALALALDGVGSVKAREIVSHREENGRFREPEELEEVNGIGPATIENNRERIVIETQ